MLITTKDSSSLMPRCSPTVSSLTSLTISKSLIGEAATNLLHWLLRCDNQFQPVYAFHLAGPQQYLSQVCPWLGLVGLVLLLPRLDPHLTKSEQPQSP